MGMFSDPVMLFAGRMRRIDVNRNVGEVTQMMEELMSHFHGDVVPFPNLQVRGDGYVYFGVKAMAQPSQTHFGDFTDSLDVIHGVSDLFDHFGIYAVE